LDKILVEEPNRFNSLDQTPGETNLWRAIRNQWMPAIVVAAIVFAGTTYRTFRETPKYQSQTIILTAKKTTLPVVSAEGSTANEKTQNDLTTEIQILKSPPLIVRALKNISNVYRDLSAEQVVSNLSIFQVGEANLLNLSYTDTDPKRAKAILETLASTYIKYSAESQKSPVSNAIEFIDKRLPQARVELNQASNAITTFRKQYNLDDPDANASLAFKTRQDLQQQVSGAEIALNQTRALYQEVQRLMTQSGQDPQTALTDSVLSQDRIYQAQVTQLRELEVQYALESTRFYPGYPTLQALKKRRDEMRQLLQKQVQRILGTRTSGAAAQTLIRGDTQQGLANQLLQTKINLEVQTNQLNSLRQAKAQATLEFQKIVQLQQRYRELQRQYKLNSEAVDNLLARLQEFRIIEAQETASWRILEPPYLPSKPISPNIQRGLLTNLVLSVLSGIGIAFLLEKLDPRIKEIQDLKKLTGLPVIGAIPKVDLKTLNFRNSEGELLQRSSPFTESINSLGLSILFQNTNFSRKIFAFTSSIPGEGKTTLTYNLGLSLGELGKRLLIVDADLNNPSIHQAFGLSNESGLSTAIAKNNPWNQLIQSGSNRFRYPDIITAGPKPPSSTTWLASPQMHELLDQWRQAYDIVLIDTPPITGSADAQSIASQVDGVVLVIGLEHSTRPAIARAMEILQGLQCQITGVVVNFLGQKQEAYYFQQDYSSDTEENSFKKWLKSITTIKRGGNEN
jgi:succinoglycan biosynthesis transport protein ExoP